MQHPCKVYASHAHATDVYLFKCASALICQKHIWKWFVAGFGIRHSRELEYSRKLKNYRAQRKLISHSKLKKKKQKNTNKCGWQMANHTKKMADYFGMDKLSVLFNTGGRPSTHINFPVWFDPDVCHCYLVFQLLKSSLHFAFWQLENY